MQWCKDTGLVQSSRGHSATPCQAGDPAPQAGSRNRGPGDSPGGETDAQHPPSLSLSLCLCEVGLGDTGLQPRVSETGPFPRVTLPGNPAPHFVGDFPSALRSACHGAEGLRDPSMSG